jgi:hypothetical protein
MSLELAPGLWFELPSLKDTKIDLRPQIVYLCYSSSATQ